MLLFLLACPDPLECDTMAAASTSVQVVDASGAPVQEATLTWTSDTGGSGACDAMPDGVWVCGWEVSGEITVTAQAEGYEDGVGSVTVPQGECHVIQQELTIVLDGIACTTEYVPGVIATLTGSSGEVLDNPVVTWEPADGSAGPEECEDWSQDQWACAFEQPGDLLIRGTAGGHTEDVEAVTVTADECHVITEEVALVVEWLPD